MQRNRSDINFISKNKIDTFQYFFWSVPHFFTIWPASIVLGRKERERERISGFFSCPDKEEERQNWRKKKRGISPVARRKKRRRRRRKSRRRRRRRRISSRGKSLSSLFLAQSTSTV